MKKPIAVLAVIGALMGANFAWGATGGIDPVPSQAVTHCHVTVGQFRKFSAKVWNTDLWRRGMPKTTTLKAQRQKLACAVSASHLKAMRNTWQKDKTTFFQHRSQELFRTRITPFYGCTSIGGCRWWPIEVVYVERESGGDYYPNFGYAEGGCCGLIHPTWAQYGGLQYSYNANEATPKEQNLIAHKVWEDQGKWAWCPFDGGC